MTDKPKPKRRWLQFSLRTLMIVVTFAAFGSFALNNAEKTWVLVLCFGCTTALLFSTTVLLIYHVLLRSRLHGRLGRFTDAFAISGLLTFIVLGGLFMLFDEFGNEDEWKKYFGVQADVWYSFLIISICLLTLFTAYICGLISRKFYATQTIEGTMRRRVAYIKLNKFREIKIVELNIVSGIAWTTAVGFPVSQGLIEYWKKIYVGPDNAVIHGLSILAIMMLFQLGIILAPFVFKQNAKWRLLVAGMMAPMLLSLVYFIFWHVTNLPTLIDNLPIPAAVWATQLMIIPLAVLGYVTVLMRLCWPNQVMKRNGTLAGINPL